MNNKTAKLLMLTFRLLVPFLLVGAICALLLISIFAFIRWDVARCYAMPPKKSGEQIKLIRIGETEESAMAKIKGYSEIRRNENSTVLVMKAIRKPWVMIAINIYIHIDLDENKKVSKISWNDG